MAYATGQGVRDIGEGTPVADGEKISDELLDDGLAYAEDLIDSYTGTSFGDVENPAFKVFSVTLDGNGRDCIRLIDPDYGHTLMFPRTLTSATIDGDAVDAGEVATWTLTRTGLVRRVSGIFPSARAGANIVIAGTAGFFDTPPATIARATKLIAREYALAAQDRTHMGALTVADEFGTTILAQPGKYGPTNIPQVNAILKVHRRKPAGVA